MSIRTAEAGAACRAGLGLALGCGWLCFDSLQRLVLPAFLWGTPLWGGGGAFTATLAAGFALWAWKADGLAARYGTWRTHAVQGASLVLALGAVAACQAAPATAAEYLAPLCLGLCGALQCAQWCGLLLALPQDTAWVALVAAAAASALLAWGCAAVPPDWLPWLFCGAVAQAWLPAAWCAARIAAPRRGRGRPPKPKEKDGLLPRLPLSLTGLAYLLCCFASPLTGKELPLGASCLGFIAGVIVCRLIGGWERNAWLVPGCCLACCCGILLPDIGGAAPAVAEGCYTAALLSLPGKRGKSSTLPIGQTLCCAALAGNLAAQLGLLGARSEGAPHILLMAAACAALGAAVCAVQILLPLWRGRRSRAHAVTEADPVLALLTAQEKLVFGLLGEGCGNRDIAERLNISEPTVRFHLRAIYKKTGQDGRPELEALARRHAATSGEHA